MILHGYEEWGDSGFDRLNGMFAVAIYDLKRNKTVIARDHFGIKPLYFSFINSSLESKTHSALIFSSELKPILYSNLVFVEPNDKIIYRYLKYRIHDDGRETFFKDIYRLMPGEMMTIEQSQISNIKCEIKKYSKLESKLLETKQTRDSLTGSQIQQFKDLLIDSIKRRLVSEVPVGTCLSGGLDSSTVVAIVNKLLQEKQREATSVGKNQNTFSAVFPGSTNDEEKYIDELKSQMSNVKSFKVYPDSETFFKDLQDFVKTQEEPTISTGPYAQYKVMEKVHEHVTVVLDGQGADEMMAGYLPYYLVYLRQLTKEKKYRVLLREVFSSWDIILKFISIKQDKKSGIKNWLNEEFAKQFSNEKFIVENSDLKKRLQEDIFYNSLQSLLRYEDKNAMRFSIEGRVPFLDFRLIQLIFSLPDEAIIKNGWNKFILRESTKDVLPSLINRRRNKIGFTTPEYEWFIKEHERILMFFKSERFEAKRYVNQAEIVMKFQDFIDGKNTDTMFFWRIMNLELWLREFILDSNNVKGQMSKVKTATQKSKIIKINTEMKIEGRSYFRYPIRTDVFKKGDNIAEKVTQEVNKAFLSHPEFISGSNSKQMLKHVQHDKSVNWFIVVSEKVVATAQGRAFFIWDIKPSVWAHVLSSYVSKVPWGIGLGSPWTMQLAIQEVGLRKILIASLAGAIGKLIGKKGWFYRIAGREAAGIDGPTEYSVYPANVSAKLLPKEPERVCQTIHEKISQMSNLKTQINNLNLHTENFLGVVIIDANDIGQNVLGNSTKLSDKRIERIFKDNPMGQSDEMTPITIVSFS